MFGSRLVNMYVQVDIDSGTIVWIIQFSAGLLVPFMMSQFDSNKDLTISCELSLFHLFIAPEDTSGGVVTECDGSNCRSEWVCSPLMSDCRATCSSSVSNSSRSLFYFIAPLCYTHSLHGFNHSNEPRRSTISFIAASQMNSHHLWAKLCQKGNHSVSVPSDFTWLQLNQKEKDSSEPLLALRGSRRGFYSSVRLVFTRDHTWPTVH